jgi:hypothetical protein
VARPKHRRLRRRMAQAKSYPEWFAAASELDRSQKRDRWLRQIDDHTCKRYNWGFIRELINDMKRARAKNDPILALAVLQQCTRKVTTTLCVLYRRMVSEAWKHCSYLRTVLFSYIF